jgi:stage III sporulation protein AH
MLTKKKKIIVLCSMLVLLVVTGVLNIVLNNSINATPTTTTTTYSSSSFFATSKQDRLDTRNESIAQYKEIISSSASSEEAKKNAQSSMDAILEAMTMETTMEGLIKAKGFSEALVNYSSTYINVILQSSELTETEVAQIVEVIQNQTNRDIDYIKIIPVE